jgi:hypothetical protein
MSTKSLTARWFEIIFAQFENEELKRALEECAQEIDCKIWYGEPGSPDIVAIGHFVEVIEWPLLGKEIWDLYLKYCKETIDDDTPCIIIDNNKACPFPDWEIPRKKKWLYVDTIDRDSINRMITFIKEIKSNLPEKIEGEDRKWRVIERWIK